MIECTALQSRVETVGLKCYFVDQTGKTPRSDRLPAKFSSKFTVTRSQETRLLCTEKLDKSDQTRIDVQCDKSQYKSI